MHDLCLLNLIVSREDGGAFHAFLSDHGLETTYSLPCRGTASKKLLGLLGLEETEKTLLWAMTSRGRAKRLVEGLVREMGLNMPGAGIAFTAPVGSVAGATSLRRLTGGQEIIIGEVTTMPDAYLYELIIAIVNRGHVDTVMDAAREAGAMGGTVLHAKGTDPGEKNRFFGMSIAEEKEMLLILTAACEKGRIMRAVMDKAGVQSPAHTVMFSMPVESVAGLRSVMAAAGQAGED